MSRGRRRDYCKGLRPEQSEAGTWLVQSLGLGDVAVLDDGGLDVGLGDRLDGMMTLGVLPAPVCVLTADLNALW